MTMPLEQRISAPVKDFVELSGVSYPLVQKMLKDGTLKSIAVGNKRLILISSYLEFFERTRQEQLGDSEKLPPLGKFRGKGAKESVGA